MEWGRREKSSVCTPEIMILSGTGPGQSQTPGFIQVSHVGSRDPSTIYYFPGCYWGAGLQVEPLGYEPVPVVECQHCRLQFSCCRELVLLKQFLQIVAIVFLLGDVWHVSCSWDSLYATQICWVSLVGVWVIEPEVLVPKRVMAKLSAWLIFFLFSCDAQFFVSS